MAHVLLLVLVVLLSTSSAWVLLAPVVHFSSRQQQHYCSSSFLLQQQRLRRCSCVPLLLRASHDEDEDDDDDDDATMMDSTTDTKNLCSTHPTLFVSKDVVLLDDRDDSMVTFLLDQIASTTGIVVCEDDQIVSLDLLSSSSSSMQWPPGVTGRVALLVLDESSTRTAPDAEDAATAVEEWTATICAALDTLAYSSFSSSSSYGPPQELQHQPILFAIERATTKNTNRYYADKMMAWINDTIRDYGLADTVVEDEVNDEPSTTPRFRPTLRYELDGAWVEEGSAAATAVWDTSSVLVFDDVVSPDLRERLLAVVEGHAGDPDDASVPEGPNPDRWQRGGLVDLPTTTTDDDSTSLSYGLTEEALAEICAEDPKPLAIQEFERSLVALLPQFRISRLPAAFLGETVTPLTANAPCAGQTFAPHIDGDPFSAPPSPWTDIYGRYANRARGHPRCMSCVVYLPAEWNATAWGAAPTRCWDVASGTAVDVEARPGRVVLMDQDITHAVVAPHADAGPRRPRYSLVWKLILHPREHQQDMRQLYVAGGGVHHEDEWCEPIFVGSANNINNK